MVSKNYRAICLYNNSKKADAAAFHNCNKMPIYNDIIAIAFFFFVNKQTIKKLQKNYTFVD